MRKSLSFTILAAAVLISLPNTLHADHWTAVASTGVVDEASLGFFSFGANPTSLGYLAGAASVNPVVARYNVTNTTGQEIATWSTLELGYLENSNNAQVSASLYQVDPCSGLRTLICTVTSVNSAVPICRTCTFDNPIDFGNFLYYVEVIVSRTNNMVNPTANTLRIF